MEMRILLINPPHLSIGSRLPGEHLPPLGLLSIGGPLIDKGHEVRLLDAEFGPMGFGNIVAETLKYDPSLVLLGHSGSTSAQPIISEITRLIRQENQSIKIVIGGVFPTYHWRKILETESQIDCIVCGEGEETIVNLVEAIENKLPLELVKGLQFDWME
jgi:anaerobic magnesium-protoporphyrin IX monomethyl ester cyclase